MASTLDNVGLQPELKAILVQGTVASLSQTISGTYTQAEVQAISTKVDAILTALRNAGIIST
jgi:hypothetical protein